MRATTRAKVQDPLRIRVSIRHKLIAVMLGTCATGLILSGGLIVVNQVRLYRQSMVVDHVLKAAMIANNTQAAVAFNDANDAALVLQTLSARAEIAYAAVKREDGTILTTYRRDGFSANAEAEPADETAHFNNGWLLVTQPILLGENRIGSVFVQSDLSKLSQFQWQITTIVAGSLLIVFVIIWLLSFQLHKLISGPIERLTQTVRHISQNRDYTIRAAHNGNDEIGVLANAFNDMLAELEKRDEKLQDREKRTQEYLDIANVMILTLDRDGRVTLINPKGCQILGLNEDDILGKNWFDHFLPEHCRQNDKAIFKKLFTDSTVTEFENVILTANDDERLMAWRHDMIRNRTGEVLGVLWSGEDITERRKAEIRETTLQEQLRRAERMETVGVLAGGVAHDLNNILGPLVMLPELIDDDLDLATKGNPDAKRNIEESISIIHDSARRAADVVKELLTLSRRGYFERTPTNINHMAIMKPDSVFIRNIKAENPAVSIAIQTDNQPLTVMASESHLGRVLENLIRNAVDASDDNGTVSITTEACHLTNEYDGYTIVPPGDYARIDIRDTGCGIPPDDLSRIFEPFYTSKQLSDRSGSGLGLSVVHGIIEDHKGFIDVLSRVGEGTRFSLYIPLTETVAATRQEDNKQRLIGKGNILVVDDESSQRLLAKTALSRLGFNVDLAENGRAALALYTERKRQQPANPYHLVVLDMRMEPDFDGLDTLKAILQQHPDQSVLIASGHAEDERSAEAIALGATWLSKPYSLKQLEQAIASLLD